MQPSCMVLRYGVSFSSLTYYSNSQFTMRHFFLQILKMVNNSEIKHKKIKHPNADTDTDTDTDTHKHIYTYT